ncbi:MAG: DUF3784 domain-containing protein [Oscillospiraceae bacterium]|nr:DUF3784 domain-containing protein [Oscillospiraceae bacterium]
MIFPLILAALGAVFVWLGLRIWKKQELKLLHDYHYDKVTEENKAAFAEMSGKGIVAVGAGIILMGIVGCTPLTEYGWIPFILGLAAGLMLLIRAGHKYNR